MANDDQKNQNMENEDLSYKYFEGIKEYLENPDDDAFYNDADESEDKKEE